MHNESVYDKLESLLAQKEKVVVGISGMKLSGKTTIAGLMEKHYSDRGISVRCISLSEGHDVTDNALNDKNPSKYYYENAFDFSFIEKELANCNEQLIIVDGILLFKNTSPVAYDLKIWVDCTFKTSIARASEGKKELVSDLYMWLMRQHFSIDDPKSKADFLIINDDVLESEPEKFVDFAEIGTFNNLKWLNEPSDWGINGDVIRVKTDAPTDFWQRTHYGFRNDNAHMFYIETEKDFEMSCHVKFKAAHQFDQCGLAVRIDEDNWLKTSIEYELGNPPKLGAVVTNLGYSDWSTEELGFNADEIEFRVTREGFDYKIEYRFDEQWQQLRICHLHNEAKNVKCGIYCCSPIDKGYSVLFKEFRIVERFF